MAMRKYRSKRKPSALRRRRMGKMRRGFALNPKPIFTETFRHSTMQLQNGFASTVLGVSVDSIPQLSQYSNLYSRYRILKVNWVVLPAITSYDAVTVPSTTANYQLCPRFVYAINDTAPPGTTAPPAPANESVILQDNGCKIRQGDRPIRFSNRPVPQLWDALGNALNSRRSYLSFNTGPNVTHWGVSIAASCQGAFNPPTTVDPAFVVYAKVTFQLADPR